MKSISWPKLPKLVRSRTSLGQAQTLYAEAPHPSWQAKLKYQPTGKSRPLALLLSYLPESRYKRLVYENRWHYCETDPALTRPHFYICKLPLGKAFDTSSHATVIHFDTIRSPKDPVCCTFPAHTVPVQLHRKNRAK